MNSPSTIFTNKTFSYIIITAIVGSLGLGGGNIYINAIDDVEDKLYEHIVDDSLQSGITITTLEYVLESQSDTKIAIKELVNEVHSLKVVVCSMKEVDC